MYEISKNNLSLSKILSRSDSLISVEGDTIVSDAKPDIMNILSIDSLINIYDTSIANDSADISGVAEFNILYSSDNPTNEIFKLSTSLPFKTSIDLPGGTNSISILADTTKIIPTILNSRKLNISATLKLTISAMENSSTEYINKIEDNENIEVLSSNIMISNFIGKYNDNIVIKEEIALPENMPEIRDILRYEYSISNKENLISDNKIIFKSDLNIYLYYTPMDDTQISEFNFNIPISGFMNTDKLSPNCNISTDYTLKNSNFSLIQDINSANRKINCEISFSIESSAMLNTPIDIISDLYSTEKNIIPSRENIIYHNIENNTSELVQIRNSFDLESTDDVKLLSCFAKVKNLSTKNDNSKMFIIGDIETTMIFESNGMINSQTSDYPFEYLINSNSNITPIICPSAFVESLEAMPSDYNKFDIKLSINLSYKIYLPHEISLLKDISEEDIENNNSSSITVYYPKKDDCYFNIGKQFNCKMNDLFELNKIDKDSKMPKMLLICK